MFSKMSDKILFCQVVNDWKHIHQRISERENSRTRANATESISKDSRKSYRWHVISETNLLDLCKLKINDK